MNKALNLWLLKDSWGCQVCETKPVQLLRRTIPKLSQLHLLHGFCPGGVLLHRSSICLNLLRKKKRKRKVQLAQFHSLTTDLATQKAIVLIHSALLLWHRVKVFENNFSGCVMTTKDFILLYSILFHTQFHLNITKHRHVFLYLSGELFALERMKTLFV